MSTTVTEGALCAGLSGRIRVPGAARTTDVPLIVALHGGTYNSRYFDLPGYSLLEAASMAGIPLIAVDRPGYGESPSLPPAEATLLGQARALVPLLARVWERYGKGTKGMVLIGHSIGAAIAMGIAASDLKFPLIGLAVSGVGLRTPEHFKGAWDSLPNTPTVELPAALKDDVMFGPAGSYRDDMPALSHLADAPAPRTELIDIVNTWHDDVPKVAARISVPVHYRQAQHDRLWIVDESELAGFGSALSSAPRVDCAMVRDTGHCMDFHRFGAAFHLQQLGFALQCASETPASR